jgi:hypothetical protein
VTVVLDPDALLGVGDGTVEGEDDAPEAPGVGVPDDDPTEDVGVADVDPVGVADGVADGVPVGCLGASCRALRPLNALPSGGLPTASSNIVMPITTMRKKLPAMAP